MADRTPVARSPLPDTGGPSGQLTLVDLSLVPKWRSFAQGSGPPPGLAERDGECVTWSVSPGEWTVTGPPNIPPDAVDLTHVRAMMRLSGTAAARVLAMVCALDLSDAMFPDGAAARTLVAGVATEIVRDDRGAPSYLLLPSRSFGRFLHDALCDAGEEHGIIPTDREPP
jgi:sarcosine oxidase subunit alpha